MSKNDKLCHLVPQTLSFFDLTMSFFDFAIAERQSCDLRCTGSKAVDYILHCVWKIYSLHFLF